MRPTEEQAAALALFLRGDSMVVDAGAGTGKTSTLALFASSTRRTGRYLAFNKSIVNDVGGKLPDRCPASTAHSLAFKAIGTRYAHRMDGDRMRSEQIARYLGLDPFVVQLDGHRKRLAPGWLAGQVMRAVALFCQTADEAPSTRHFPYVEGIDTPDGNGRRTFENNIVLARELEGAARKAWLDISNVDGHLPFGHPHYLKLWQLSNPVIDADYILFDEAQDANPVMAAVVGAQEHAQQVYVGDENQAIYEWTGAVNAMAGFDAQHRRVLTLSFRFGPAIADVANIVLEELGSDLRIRGLDVMDSTVGELDDGEEPDVLLCRTNAAVLSALFAAQERHVPTHLVGGGTEIAKFARAARELKAGRSTSYYDLSCFDSWDEVLSYVRDDPQGSELALYAKLVEDFGIPKILAVVEGAIPEGPGVLSVSTAHKAKGREWPVVKLAEDFADRDLSEPELRLRYVALTRAREHLDDSVLHASTTA